VKTLWSRRLTVDVLDGAAIGVSQLTGDFATASSVMFLLRLGETLEEWTHKRSVEDLARSMALQVDAVWRLDDEGGKTLVPLNAVSPGDLVIVHTGHVLPLDGILESGDVMLNQASLTGESVPVDKNAGDRVSAATINRTGFIKCRAEKVGEDTTLAQIIKLVSDASASKAPIARIADKVSGVFVTGVMIIALAVFVIWMMTGAAIESALTHAIAVLVVSCTISRLNDYRAKYGEYVAYL
jgi:Cu2+-exporting ATPase